MAKIHSQHFFLILPDTMFNFADNTSFKRTINDVDYSDFLKVFHSNFIIQYLLFSTFLSYCTMLLYVMGSCKCCRSLSDPWNTCLYCSYCFSVFSDCLCFQNKLMMMMTQINRKENINGFIQQR